MIRRLSTFWTAFTMLVWTGTAFSAEPVRVMTMPFDIRAPQNMAYLSTEIPKIIQDNLSAEGADVVEAPELSPAEVQQLFDDADGMRQKAGRGKANYVIWGKLVFEGKKFQLTARLSPVPGMGAPEEFQSSGDGIESLSGAVRSLAGDIASRLFQRVRITQIRVTGNQRIEADAIQAAMNL